MSEFALAHPWMTFFLAAILIWETGSTLRSMTLWIRARRMSRPAPNQEEQL